MKRVMSKAGRRKGIEYPSVETEYLADISGDTIRISREYRNERCTFPKTFRVGDICEYDSYNLSYLGTIVKITEKAVTITPRYSKETVRLSLYVFCWRNYNFDLEKTEKQNHETSLYI